MTLKLFYRDDLDTNEEVIGLLDKLSKDRQNRFYLCAPTSVPEIAEINLMVENNLDFLEVIKLKIGLNEEAKKDGINFTINLSNLGILDEKINIENDDDYIPIRDSLIPLNEKGIALIKEYGSLNDALESQLELRDSQDSSMEEDPITTSIPEATPSHSKETTPRIDGDEEMVSVPKSAVDKYHQLKQEKQILLETLVETLGKDEAEKVIAEKISRLKTASPSLVSKPQSSSALKDKSLSSQQGRD